MRGGTRYKANTGMEAGKAKHLSIRVNFWHSECFYTALCEQNYQHSMAFTCLTIYLCCRTISLSPKAVNQEVSNRMTTGFKPMFALRLETLKEVATSFPAKVDVCLTLSWSTALARYRDISSFIPKESKMSARQERIFLHFLLVGRLWHFKPSGEGNV